MFRLPTLFGRGARSAPSNGESLAVPAMPEKSISSVRSRSGWLIDSISGATRRAAKATAAHARNLAIWKPRAPRPPSVPHDKRASIFKWWLGILRGGGDPHSIHGQSSRYRPGFWFVVSALVFIGSLAAVDAALFIQSLYQRSVFLGGALTALAAIALWCAARWAAAELNALRRLKDAAAQRAEVEGQVASGESGWADKLILKLRSELPPRTDDNQSPGTADDRPREPRADRDALKHFAHEILHPLDARASDVVARAARQTSLGVAANPVAMLDAVLVLWRSVRMIRDIAEIYGFQPGAAATAHLARRVLSGAASAALADAIGDTLGAQITGRVAAVVSPKLAEGVVAAVRIARLGNATIELCRPLPFLDSDETALLRRHQQAASRAS